MRITNNRNNRPSLLLCLGFLIQWLLSAAATNAAADSRAMVERQLEASRTMYTTPASWATRRAALREGFLKGAQLWPLPPRTPLNPVIHSRREYDEYTVENVALETMPGFYCTGNLYRPRRAERKSPAILCPHGHFQPLGRFREEQQIRCAHLARMGATVFSYSMVGWQDSTQTTHKDPLVLALQTWNSIRVIDFLASLDGVDPNRVAVTGASGGGTQAFYVTLVDDRVKVSAPVVIVYPWTEPDGCVCEGGMPVMQATQTNAIELAAAAAPRPQLLISAGNDPTRDFPQIGFPFIKHVYELHGRGDAVANVHLANEGHDFGPSKRRVVYEFLGKHLDLDLKEEDATTITIERPEQMQLFDDEHPLPAHAVRGSDAVAKTFRDLPRPPAPKPADPRLASIEASLFTPAGFDKEGRPVVASGPDLGQIKIVVRDAKTGKPTCCRINVVGPDGNYYQPTHNDLSPYALTGQWPKVGRGNREGKAPIRYYGRFFYSRGESLVGVLAGEVRIEVWKGIEYRPEIRHTAVAAGQNQTIEFTLTPTVTMSDLGYFSGDPHLHLKRETDADDQRILDLLEAEDVRYGSVLAYNEPAGPYAGLMDRMDTPQRRGLGERSVYRRGEYQIMSGQEYRSTTFGHLNLYLLDEVVLPGTFGNANDWPPYGDIIRDARQRGGFTFFAHGGYAQSIYADFVQGNLHGVELLQFGVYRGIGLEDWYRALNVGYRLPCIAASDYPACRKLADCVTYVHHLAVVQEARLPNEAPTGEPPGATNPPTFAEWLREAAEGRSFVTTGPLLLLEVDGQKPGAIIRRNGPKPQTLTAHVRVLSELAPVTHVQLIVGGKIVRELVVAPEEGKSKWLDLKHAIELNASSWIAARAFSQSDSGEPDAEAHTNPVYFYLNGKAPYDEAALDTLVQRIDGQIAAHAKRSFPEQAGVVQYFERSRDLLIKLRQARGMSADAVPSASTSTASGGRQPTDPRNQPADTGRSQSPGSQSPKEGQFDPSARTHTDAELREFLKPLPPKSPEEALKTFETVGGFRMELVAAEPLVYDPVAAAFDEDGRIYVAELRDYPYMPKPGDKPLGTIRLLEDTDGDGTFDRSTVFADELLWAAGIAPWKGGVFVAASPDIWYLKDTDGDRKADVRRKIFTGFGTQNQQGMLNNLIFGLDHKIYGATSVNGGTVRLADDVNSPAVRIDGRDFRFDPVTGQFETVTGTRQFGNTFDDWGNRFLCSESQPLLHAVLPQDYLARNPYLPVPTGVHNLAPAPVPVFRSSPLERWRIIRSARRIAHGERPATMPGASHHVVDAAAGVTVYRGGAYPKEYYGNVFVGDAQNNLIHRRTLVPDGPTFQSLRADDKTEFVRSSDNWFRPVNFVNAPDGTLYVLDMSREVLEAIHIPLDVVKHLDLTRGRDQGRIYRLAPPNFRSPPPPRLGRASGDELVAALESPHGWWRDTAHRLIYERQDKSLTDPLRQLVRKSKLPHARVHAIWSLHGLGTLDNADLAPALAYPTPEVRAHAVRLAESRLNEAADLRKKVIDLASDPDARVRFQVAFTLGQIKDPQASLALARLAREHADNSWMRTAVLSSVAESASSVLVELLSDPAFAGRASGAAMLEQLAIVIGVRNRADEVEQALDAVAAHAAGNGELAERLVLSLGSGLKRAGTRLTVPEEATTPGVRLAARMLAGALATAGDTARPEPQRVRSIQLLSCFPADRVRGTLAELLDEKQTLSVQVAAVRALADDGETAVADILLRRWRQYLPAVRTAALEALLSREPWTLALLQAAEKGDASLTLLDSTRRDLLLKHRNLAIANLARTLFGNSAGNSPKALVADYLPALKLVADAQRGQGLFRQHCMACHKIGNNGFAVGPDLTTSATRDPAALLTHILDPNQYVLPNFIQYLIADRNGRIFTGLIAAETATSITLRRDNNAEDAILRSDIEEMTSTGKSLMPEGFERQLTPQDMADLLSYLGTIQPAPPLDIGTTPGLVEPSRRP